ncbi:hypothetical protein IKG50_01480 [Candidatus Saccharibacteria bacterium]|nr:hypothetical protein [Candidatus Saccharibacteria bacterium]
MTKRDKEELYALINENSADNDKNFKKLHEVVIETAAKAVKAIATKIDGLSSDMDKNFKKMSEENQAIAVSATKNITTSVNKHTDVKINQAVVDIKNTINSKDDNIFDGLELLLVGIVSAVIAFFAFLWMHAQATAGVRFVKPDYSSFVPGATDDAGNVLSYVNPMVPDNLKIWIWTILIAVFIFTMYCLIRILVHKK